MLKTYSLPYGKATMEFSLDANCQPDLYLPTKINVGSDQISLVNYAIRNPLFNCGLPKKLTKETNVVITINDKTRPVPNNLLFPPLLEVLDLIGVKKENILILIATGTHLPMAENEFSLLIRNEFLQGIKILSHDCDNEPNLTYKGTTSRGTTVFVNRLFDNADIKIVVGDIEPHHFAGFSGGAKSAAIGVCGRKTINQNHSLLQNPKSCVGNYEDNPLRQDIEEIGELIGVNLALNAVLNEKKEIMHVFFGKPKDVLEAGIKTIRESQLTSIERPYDLVIASAGGYPKDINLYQAQKALTHASLFCKTGGTVFLAVACEEGVGSQGYVDFMQGISSHKEARQKFADEGFKVGPHKAFQFAAIAERIQFQIKSEIKIEMMKKLCIQSVDNLSEGIISFLKLQTTPPRIAIVPYATATIPQVTGGENE